VCTRSRRSTPTAGLKVALGVPPLDVFLQQMATTTAFRIRPTYTPAWDGQTFCGPNPHRRHPDNVTRTCQLEGLPVERKELRHVWGLGSHQLVDDGVPVCGHFEAYTDGSHTDQGTGCAWAVHHNDSNAIIAKGIIPLSFENSVYQAEMLAINACLSWLLTAGEALQGSTIIIRSDSQSAITAIFGAPLHCTMLEYETALLAREVRSKAKLAVVWVRGHADETGNEYADALAKAASERQGTGPEPLLPLPWSAVKQRLRAFYDQIWQERWTTSTEYTHTRAMISLGGTT